MTSTTDPSTSPNFEAIKIKQRATWSSGDYSKIGSTLQLTGEELAEALAMAPDSCVLDVAAGNGNVTLALARRWCQVTSTDYVEELLERGRQRAEAEGLEVDFKVADAERLPFEKDQFDAVVSTFGVMFAPNKEAAASELLRVCRRGGKIGMANWTPRSFIGRLFKTIGKHVPPPAGVTSPAAWGDREWLDAHFGEGSSKITVELKNFVFLYRSPAHFLEFFRTYYGPVEKAFAALAPEARGALEADILALVADLNIATDGTMRVPAEYAEVQITKA